MQYRITEPGRLLDSNGELIQKGYATWLILEYRKKDVARKLRLKQWDYYLIYNDDYGLAMTIGDSKIAGLISVTFIDFLKGTQTTKTVVTAFPWRKYNLPESSETGNISYKNRNVELTFKHVANGRRLAINIRDFLGGTSLEATVFLTDEPRDSMVIATPFYQSKKMFFYNQKTVGMRAEGYVVADGVRHEFSPADSFGILDWGRGVWPYRTTWYWSAASGIVEGKVFGFNFGYGFGDTSAATENMLFYDGIASKLCNVVFVIPKDALGRYDYMKEWIISSFDGRVELIFSPIIDRSVHLNAFILSTEQHQVFGTFKGKVVLDEGKELWIRNLMGFAERVQNRW